MEVSIPPKEDQDRSGVNKFGFVCRVLDEEGVVSNYGSGCPNSGGST